MTGDLFSGFGSEHSTCSYSHTHPAMNVARCQTTADLRIHAPEAGAKRLSSLPTH